MGVTTAGLGLLADAVSSARTFVSVFIYVYVLLIFLYVLTSWLRLPYSLNRVQRFLYDVCDPYLRLYRRFLPPLGPLDLSPVVAVIVLVLIERLIVSVLGRLH
jgi:YggT family protein